MEYMSDQQSRSGTGNVLCCECGVPIAPNPANTCVACLRNRVDISEGIPKQATLYFCRNCERYLQPPSSWVKASLESKELLALCLKKMKGIDKGVRLVDAGFLWTEPHSKRIKVKVVIQKEVVQGAVLQQTFVVEYIVHNQMCDDCHRVEAKDFWKACVQVRQKTTHKKTLFYLEQLILKHRAHANATSIKQVHEGLDFFYQHQQDAKKMAEFLQAVIPCRCNNAKELISHDARSNIYNYKYTNSIEIVPLCKDNVVCLPLAVAQQLGNIGQICVVYRVTHLIYLIDPSTCRIASMRGEVFWRNPIVSLCHPKQLIEYIVMHVEVVTDRKPKNDVIEHNSRHGQGSESLKHVLGEVWVVKASELGVNDQQFHCRTHLGHLLKPGDSVLGFDMKNSNVNDQNLEKMNQDRVPDVIIVKKMYGDASKRASKRQWKLHRLEKENEDNSSTLDKEFDQFLDDLEEDPDTRQGVVIYKDATKIPVDADDTDDDNAPCISLAEMVDEMHISEDATGGEGDAMME